MQLAAAKGPECASSLAARLGRYALCSCASIVVMRNVTSDSVDSAVGMMPSKRAAAIGTPGSLEVSGAVIIGGDL